MAEERPKPIVDMTLGEAVKELTGFEVLAIQKEFSNPMESLSGIESLMGTVWAFEIRNAKKSWADIKKMTLNELNFYFAERKESDPDSEQGKDED